ncbi:MAG: hypothetical protein MJ054_00230 [Clostridia bacterium]|nr:hypothetical protein [Clostridia bacterium]
MKKFSKILLTVVAMVVVALTPFVFTACSTGSDDRIDIIDNGNSAVTSNATVKNLIDSVVAAVEFDSLVPTSLDYIELLKAVDNGYYPYDYVRPNDLKGGASGFFGYAQASLFICKYAIDNDKIMKGVFKSQGHSDTDTMQCMYELNDLGMKLAYKGTMLGETSVVIKYIDSTKTAWICENFYPNRSDNSSGLLFTLKGIGPKLTSFEMVVSNFDDIEDSVHAFQILINAVAHEKMIKFGPKEVIDSDDSAFAQELIKTIQTGGGDYLTSEEVVHIQDYISKYYLRLYNPEFEGVNFRASNFLFEFEKFFGINN